ncbi:MAG TPA: hypothetical protein VGO25_12515 [Rhodanobacteraceae bacterium]|nr:hypothetical protein [Rhodanobacteraceae bacterium]
MDRMTLAAIGVLAMCIVTTAHEALGHGAACLLAGGNITLLTSSMFRCSVASPWIDPAGPATNLLVGSLAWFLRATLPLRSASLRMLLLAITALAYFWEGAYLVDAMLTRSGDAYLFLRSMSGDVAAPERIFVASVGLALYIACVRMTARAIALASPNERVARICARLLWLGAMLSATAAAAFCRVAGLGNLRDAMLEIGAASLPLLLMRPRAQPARSTSGVPTAIERNFWLIALTLVAYVAFVATLGHGIV